MDGLTIRYFHRFGVGPQDQSERRDFRVSDSDTRIQFPQVEVLFEPSPTVELFVYLKSKMY